MQPTSLLVGDVGSTKSTWRFHPEDSGVIHLSGYNPVAHDAAVGMELFEKLLHETSPRLFSQIWYYGSGVVDEGLAKSIRESLSVFFPASEIHVASDLAGAAMAACGAEPGCIAILGTGSHAAVFDGHKIVRQATSLGFILGDEGGGADIGKALLQAYFYREMPDEVRLIMEEKLPDGGREGLLKSLSHSPFPNRFLADFARVAASLPDHPWIQHLVRSRFTLFVKRHLVPLDPKSQVHIIGSIGCIFAGLIRDELEQTGYAVGTFIQDPALRLFEIHMEHEKQ